MPWGSFSWEKLWGPCGVCSGGAAGLIVVDVTTSAELAVFMAWYLLAAGVGYAGRLPIHVFGLGYVTWRPSLSDNPKQRRRLNFLTCMNAFLAILWLAMALFLVGNPSRPLWLESAVGLLFYGFVMLLGMLTVECATDLGLGRGTEWVCRSWLGRRFKSLRNRAPEKSAMRRGMDAVPQPNPPHQASWFLALVAAALLALPSSALSAKTAEEALDKDRIEQTTEKGAGGSGQPGEGEGVVASDSTYEGECPDGAEPGTPAPSPRGEELRALWLGGGGIDGAGAIEAGCADRATPAREHPEVWVASGYCGSSFRSLGVAAPNYLPALLYQGAGEFAREKVRSGELRGASSRWQVGEGDGYVVDTDDGSWVLARRRASGGDTETSGDLPCERFEEVNVPYVAVPPGLIGHWLEIGEDGWVWPTHDPDDPDGFVFRDEDGKRVAQAHCYTDLRCAAWIDGILRPTTGSPFTSVSGLLSMAER